LECSSRDRVRLETEYHWCRVFRTGQLITALQPET
jgi:hypothetical protein